MDLAHERGEDVRDKADGEAVWWVECWNCGYICRCEV